MPNIKKLFKKFLGIEDFVSELDRFLKEYDVTHPRVSASQRQEMKKYARIFRLRDQSTESASTTTVWDNF